MGVEGCVQRGERRGREEEEEDEGVLHRPPHQTLAISQDHWN